MNEERDPLMVLAASNNEYFNEHRNLSDQQEEQDEEYEAGGGKMSYHGVVYQLRLLMFFILRGLENKYSFSLATDMKDAEKFDDVVLRTKKGSSMGGNLYRLLQAKHRAGEKITAKITAAALLSDSAKGDFSLRAYLESYLKLKSKFTSNVDEIIDLIICTNVKFKENDSFGKCKLKNAFEERENLDEIFRVKLLRFSNEGKRVIKESLKKPSKGITHNEDDIESFLNLLSFAMDQYGNDDLEKQNKLLLQKLCCISNTKIAFPLFEKKISEWMMSFKGSYFSEQAARKFIQSLKDKFGELSFELQDPVWNFIGREQEMEEIESARKNKFKNIVVISGLGGMGKSELAKKYIQKHASVFKRVAWMAADSRGSLMNSFHGLAKRLGIDENEKQMKSILDEVYAYFDDKESIFVFDSVEKLSNETEHNHYIKDFLPIKSENLFIIMTSRIRWNWEDAHNLMLTEMKEENTVNFIKSNLPPDCHSSDESIKTLANELQNYPLAMQQAVAFIKRNYYESASFGEIYCISNYLKSFKEEASKILSCNLFSSSRHLYERTTMSTWNMTFNSIKETKCGDMAVKILKLISHFSPNNIDIKNIFIYFREAEEEKVKVSLTLLKEFSVIDLQCKKIRIHRLVQKVIRLKLKEVKEDEEILNWALEFVREIEVEQKISLWEKLDEYKQMQIEHSYLPGHIMKKMKDSLRFEHAYLFGRKCVSILKEICKPTDANLLTAINYFAVLGNFQGHPNEALNVFEDILGRVMKEECDYDKTLRAPYQIVLNDAYPGEYLTEFMSYHERYKMEKNIRGNDKPDMLSSKFGMATCHTLLGNYREALQLFDEINDRYKEILGENHPNTLTSKCSLGFTYLNLHDPAKALILFEEVIACGKLVFGECNPILLLSKHGIANCYVHLGDKHKALKLLKDVNEKQKYLQGEKHHRTMNTSFEIANCYLHFDDTTKALMLFENLYEKQKEIHGDIHNNTLLTKYKIAYCHSKLGDNTKALILFEDVYEKQKEIQGENYNNTLITKYRIADCYLKLGDKIKSLNYLEDVYKKLKDLNGEYNNNTLNSKHGIANFHLNFGDKKKALLLFQDVYEKQKEIIGEENHNTLISKFGIANCHLKLGHYKEASKIFEELHEKQKNINGENHHDTLNTKLGIANCLSKLGDNMKALNLFEYVYEKQKDVLGDNNTNILNLKSGIATCHLNLGDNRKALMFFEEVYKKENEIHGESHLRTLNTKYKIAKCNLSLGNDTAAFLLFEDVFEKRKEIFGENHPVVKATRKDITEFIQTARRNKCLLF